MKKVAIYMRLSKEDEYIRDESNSISNQRAFLRKHIRSIPELKKLDVIEFKDDGYTGKNMNRPGMQELLDMVKAQKIECIVVKDISRFSRDHLETGKYLEQIFPFMGVERLEDEADAMPDGFSADQDEIQADQLTREMTEAFVEKVIVWPGQKLEIRWKTKK